MPKLIKTPDRGRRVEPKSEPRRTHDRSRRVSILITARNYSRFLPEAIESAINQTVPCEIVYSDDYSQDDSVEVARRYETRGLLVLTAFRHLGVATARNRAVAASSGDLLVHLDGDDTMPPTFVADHLERMTDSTPYVYGPARAFGEGPRVGTLWGVPEWDKADIWRGNSCNTSSMYARWAFEAVGGWRDGIGTMWDWDLALRAQRFGKPAASKATLNYRQHPGSWSHQLGEFEDHVRPDMQAAVRRNNARLSVGMLWSGRLPELAGQVLTDIRNSVQAAGMTADLTVLDNSRDESARDALRTAMGVVSMSDVFSCVRHIRMPREIQQTPEKTRRDQVAGLLADAYNEIRRRSSGELLWLVEDDVLVPPHACEYLVRAATSNTRAWQIPHAVSGWYRSRHLGRDHYLAGWRRNGNWEHATEPSGEPVQVDFSGTGCMLLWKDRTPEFRSHVDGIPAHDWAFGEDIRQAGGEIRMVPDLICRHVISITEFVR